MILLRSLESILAFVSSETMREAGLVLYAVLRRSVVRAIAGETGLCKSASVLALELPRCVFSSVLRRLESYIWLDIDAVWLISLLVVLYMVAFL